MQMQASDRHVPTYVQKVDYFYTYIQYIHVTVYCSKP